jgi:hypothetical protein
VNAYPPDKKAPPLFGCDAVRQKLDQFENHPSQVSVCNGNCHDGWSILCSYRPPHLLAARPAQTIDRHTSRITRNVTEPEAEPLGGPTFQVAISGQPGRHSCEPRELLCCRIFRTARVSDISTLNQLLEYDAGWQTARSTWASGNAEAGVRGPSRLSRAVVGGYLRAAKWSVAGCPVTTFRAVDLAISKSCNAIEVLLR